MAHLDLLTPGNIILCWNKKNTAARVVIIDFGMAETQNSGIDWRIKDINHIQFHTASLGDFCIHFEKGYNTYRQFPTELHNAHVQYQDDVE